MEEKLQKDLIYEKHRLEGLERDAQRWEKMEQEHARHHEIQDYKKKVFLQGKHNMSGYVSFHPFIYFFFFLINP